MSEQPLIKATKISKTIGNKTIVNQVSLEAYAGEVVGLLGSNGAGKTTLFYILTGLMRANEGQVFLQGQNVSDLSLEDRAKLGLGYLPQDASIFQGMSVNDNIACVLQLQKHLSQQEQQEKLAQLINQFRLESIRYQLGSTLSGGERRRTEIARILAINPTIILLDEPFAGIDPRSIEETKTLIQHLTQQNISVLITDHNARDTLGICHRAYILEQGSVLTEGTPDNLIRNQQVKKAYLGESFTI